MRDNRGTIKKQRLREGTDGRGKVDGRRKRRVEGKVHRSKGRAKKSGRVAFWNVRD